MSTYTRYINVSTKTKFRTQLYTQEQKKIEGKLVTFTVLDASVFFKKGEITL